METPFFLRHVAATTEEEQGRQTKQAKDDCAWFGHNMPLVMMMVAVLVVLVLELRLELRLQLCLELSLCLSLLIEERRSKIDGIVDVIGSLLLGLGLCGLP